MIGGGVMGEALISRLIMKSVYQPIEILVSEPNGDRRSFLQSQYGVQVTSKNSEAALASDVVLLAIKPQIFFQVATELTASLPHTSAVLLSILAGTSIAQLEAAFPEQPILRAMPNTPAQVGAGVTAIARGQHSQPHHVERARTILETVGSVIEIPESLMDAVTGLSGSGPGYVALVVEALADGGVAAGLPRPIALQLAIQTVLGTAQLLQESGLHPGELKDRVTSPGGTTIAGIAQLEKQGLRSALIEAVRAASNRSKELGNQ
ncbi:pyrroline-5-carboxylate reductase [Alkalinema sp. FACHB-956]|uniref:pyrroline-5-carboxylate reductase n=1 Tax=Alkalinema sp. FACHB-956 TaxID=2692768 RepID=UPI001685075E|nr:pyrroline-5-carboxylate reductase [Alkalinema sp. FACHB-956]MBD2329012.1 pyrroline-5-carboxylate reductase [Alkalinema sp. FACHB-956]